MLKKAIRRSKLGSCRLMGAILKHIMDTPKAPVFILGCQRSGTTMLDRVFSLSPQISAYGESGKIMDSWYRMLPDGNINYLICTSPGSVIVFKPLNDSQQITRILKTFHNSKVIWIYRNYSDVANSMVAKWETGLVRLIRALASNNSLDRGTSAVAEGINPEHRKVLHRISRLDLSAHDASAFVWFLRNSLYFEHKSDLYQNVLLCRYEDMVMDPETQFLRIFSFIQADFSPEFTTGVHRTSVNRTPSPTIISPIAEMCTELTRKLDQEYQKSQTVN